MTKNRPAAKTPTIAIARVLRDLGLIQGTDFRVRGDYRNGVRVGTYVYLHGAESRQTVAAFADEIEGLVKEQSGFTFQVSIRYSSTGNPFPTIANTGDRVREAAPVAAPVDEPTTSVVPADAEITSRALSMPDQRAEVRRRGLSATPHPYDGLAQKRFGSLTWACEEARQTWFFQNTANSARYTLRAYRGRANANGWYLSDGKGGSDFMGRTLTKAAEACADLILRDLRT